MVNEHYFFTQGFLITPKKFFRYFPARLRFRDQQKERHRKSHSQVISINLRQEWRLMNTHLQTNSEILLSLLEFLKIGEKPSTFLGFFTGISDLYPLFFDFFGKLQKIATFWGVGGIPPLAFSPATDGWKIATLAEISHFWRHWIQR